MKRKEIDNRDNWDPFLQIMNKIIAITPGEPSGIGPDITLKCLPKK